MEMTTVVRNHPSFPGSSTRHVNGVSTTGDTMPPQFCKTSRNALTRLIMSCIPTANYTDLCNNMKLPFPQLEKCWQTADKMTAMCTAFSQQQCILSDGVCKFKNTDGTIIHSERSNAHGEHAGFYSVLGRTAAAAQGTGSS